VNAYVLDRDGNRIDRRNAQDIFVPLYNHQIPPGAADVVHYRLSVPDDVRGPITLDAALHYRKFDTTYVRYFQGEAFQGNDLPITTLARASLTLPVAGAPPAAPAAAAGSSGREGQEEWEGWKEWEEWQRWNDYGIGLLRKGTGGSSKGELRQAEAAFQRVEALGRAEGALNLARVYLKEGRLDEAAEALARASSHDPPALPWSVAWFSGQVDKQNGYLEEAAARFEALVETRFAEARARGFDFSKDVRLLVELGETRFELAKLERGEARGARRAQLLADARATFERALEIDPENVAAHFNLSLIFAQLGDEDRARHHRELHARYKPDDNARDRAVAIQRRANPAADHAAEAIVIYDLRDGSDPEPGDRG